MLGENIPLARSRRRSTCSRSDRTPLSHGRAARVARPLDGPRPERVALLSGDYRLNTQGHMLPLF
jgi:hypothetical protein